MAAWTHRRTSECTTCIHKLRTSRPRSVPGSVGPTLCGLVCMFAILSATGRAQPLESSASLGQVQENFIHHFVNLTTWPQRGGQLQGHANGRERVVCFLGAAVSSVARAAEARSRRTDTRTRVLRLPGLPWRAGSQHLQRLLTCHALFTRMHVSKLQDLLGRLRRSSILTIGEGRDFAAAGGIIAFERRGRRLQFVVNLQQARSSNLILSSSLLRHAHAIVETR